MTSRWVKLVLVCVVVFASVASGAGASLRESRLVVSAAPGVAGTYVPLGGARVKHSSPGAADFNADGYEEIVVGASDGMLYVVAYNGVTWSVVWSRQTADDLNAPNPTSTTIIESAPAIADLDDDGRLEIVVTVGGDPIHHKNGGVLVYTYNSAWSFAVKGGWPQALIDELGSPPGSSYPDGYWDGIWNSPTLGDLDGDGDLEVVVIGFNRRIFAWHHTGSAVEGWPVHRNSGDTLLRGSWASPALGDIDGDGLPEVVVGTNSPPWDGVTNPDYTKASLWAINGDSTNVPGFPVETDQWMQSSPALGDIDGDGELEIVVGSGEGIAGTGGYKVRAWNNDGTVVTGWPRATGGNVMSSPALADLDGDGGLDVIVGCGSESDSPDDPSSCKYLYAWRGDGTDVPGFPMQPLDANPAPWSGSQQPQLQPYSPVVADIDGDDDLEILMVMVRSIGVSIVQHDGTMSTDYSRIQDHGYDVISAPPLVSDVDNDGFLETVVAGEGDGDQAAVYIWDEVGSVDDALPWPMFHQNVSRTGRYPLPPRLDFPGELRFMHQQGAGSTVTLYAVVRNLGEGEMSWEITNPIQGLEVSSASGTAASQTSVEFTLDVTGRTIGMWHNLGDLVVSGEVDGQPVQGSPQTVPVWLYTGDVSSIYLPTIIRGL